MSAAHPVRPAVPGDAAELTRLRTLLYESTDVGADWQRACEEHLRRRIAEEPDTFVAVVGDDPDRPGRLLACGMGWIERHIPSPQNPLGRRGHISTMVTEPAAQRRGWGAAIFSALLAYYAGHGIGRVDLNASAAGERLYRRYGFVERGDTPLTWYASPADVPPWG